MSKYIIAGLLAALMTTGMVSGAAFAGPVDRFELIDADQDGHITTVELDSRGCKFKRGIINYVDENKNGTIERAEFKWNYSLVKSCK